MTWTRLLRPLAIVAILGAIGTPATAQDGRIYWADEVPDAWNGNWPDELRTAAELSDFTRTMSTLQLLEFINVLKWRSENLHVVNMFTSPRGKSAPAVVLSNPRVRSPQQARASGKPVVFLMGNIHPPESEAAEAMLLVMRDLLLGDRGDLLENQIVAIAPVFNVDGTDTFVLQGGGLGSVTPHISGIRANSDGLDLNREGVKVESVEANGLYRFLNAWDPVLFLDGHLMGRVSHGYANTYGTSTVPAAHPGPRGYVTNTLFPAVRAKVREEFGLEVFSHALFSSNPWPPTEWSHDRAAWTVEAKFVVNDYGLRNRMAIITETPGQPTFERRIYAQYAYLMALLEYTNEHAAEMQDVVRAADEDTVERVLAGAESGELRNWVAGEYISGGKIDVLGYRTNEAAYIPGTSARGTRDGTASGEPEVLRGLEDLTVPVGTRDAWMPRGYLIPAELDWVAAKLEAHNIEVSVLDESMEAEGEQFVVDRMSKARSRGYQMTVLDGEFVESTRDFPAGTFFVDMAQPMANAAFYYLEPEAKDGFVGWSLFDRLLRDLGVEERSIIYPVFKFRKEIE